MGLWGLYPAYKAQGRLVGHRAGRSAGIVAYELACLLPSGTYSQVVLPRPMRPCVVVDEHVSPSLVMGQVPSGVDDPI